MLFMQTLFSGTLRAEWNKEQQSREELLDGGNVCGSETGFFICSCGHFELDTLSVWWFVAKVPKGEKEAPNAGYKRPSTFFSPWESSWYAEDSITGQQHQQIYHHQQPFWAVSSTWLLCNPLPIFWTLEETIRYTLLLLLLLVSSLRLNFLHISLIVDRWRSSNIIYFLMNMHVDCSKGWFFYLINLHYRFF